MASYSPVAIASGMKWLERKSLSDRIIHLCSRLAFRGIYFPQMRWRQWLRVLFENQGPILQVAAGALKLKFASRSHNARPADAPEREQLPA